MTPVREAPPHDKATCLEQRGVLVDCRWLGIGGIGRVTELLLTDLGEAHAAGNWKLWGDPERVAPFLFAGAAVIPWRGDPQRWFGQADLLRVPSNEVAIYLHQIRPLRPGRSIQFVHDTIPLHHEPRRAVRFAKRFFFSLACRLSSRIITVSVGSQDAIVRDLGVPRAKISIVGLTVDARRVERVRALRRTIPGRDDVVFVGRFARHKNLYRLCRAFQATNIHGQGGRLVLVGGTDGEVASMSLWLAEQGLTCVDVLGVRSEGELDELLAACRALVQPSLEEGFGLPAIEAAAVGVQVAASRVGYAAEIPIERVTFLDPLDVHSIAAAIDEAVARPDVEAEWLPRSTVGEGVLRAATRVLC